MIVFKIYKSNGIIVFLFSSEEMNNKYIMSIRMNFSMFSVICTIIFDKYETELILQFEEYL